MVLLLEKWLSVKIGWCRVAGKFKLIMATFCIPTPVKAEALENPKILHLICMFGFSNLTQNAFICSLGDLHLKLQKFVHVINCILGKIKKTRISVPEENLSKISQGPYSLFACFNTKPNQKNVLLTKRSILPEFPRI